MVLRIAAVCSLLLMALAGCGGKGKSNANYTAPSAPLPPSGGAPWPAPQNAMALTRRAGLRPERAEFLQYHVHAHLYIFVNGKPVSVPGGIGINIADPAVQGDPSSGYGLSRICAKPCISPLHTHDDSGILHTETKTVAPNKLGQFFTEWGVRLDQSCVDGFCTPKSPIAVFVNSKRYTGDPRNIELSDGSVIVILIGSPPSTIPTQF